MKKPARYFKKLDNNKIHCLLCPVGCKLKEGQEGVCFGRKVIDGELIATNYAQAVAVHVDPIEKKPLYHFHPGEIILSVGPNGCNLFCKHCQNWGISQIREPTRTLMPEELIAVAKKEKSTGIAYTYAEPFIWYEYLHDACRLAHENGLVNVIVSNGYINLEPLQEIIPHFDAINIDVKSMREDFYKKICKGKLSVVKNSVEATVRGGKHVEVTYLVITDVNDSDAEIQDLIDWLASIDNSIPLHFSRYFPNYKMDYPTTPIKTLERAYEMAKKKMKYVYVGNTHLEGTSDTFCPECDNQLVNRSGYFTRVVGIDDGKCSQCGAGVDFVL